MYPLNDCVLGGDRTLALRVIRVTAFPHAPESMLAEERQILRRAGAEVVPVTARTTTEMIDAVEAADGLITTTIPITAEVMAAMPNCRAIVAAGIGFDHVDLAATTARGIIVANVPDFCVREVANHTIGLLLACARKIVRLNLAMQAGRWDRTMLHPMSSIYGQTLGLLSFGRIAREVAQRARAFDLRVIAHDPYVAAETAASLNVALVSLDELLQQSEYLSVHAPRTNETHHLLSDREFALMKPTALLFNTGRGGVVDEAALVRALGAGQIAGAGIDVFEQEPIPPDHPLIGMENVVLTPHAAGYSDAAIGTVRRLAAEEMARILQGEPPHHRVDQTVANAAAGTKSQ